MPIRDDLLNPKRRNPLAVPFAVVVLLGLVGGAFALGRMSGNTGATPAAPAELAAGGGGTPGAAAVPAAPVAEAPPAPTEVKPGDVLPGTDGLRRIEVEVNGPLTTSINALVGPEVGDPLALVSSRLLVWWIDVVRDSRPGDVLEVLYSLPAGEEPLVHAIRYESRKMEKTYQAYRFQVPGSDFGRYYDEKGQEVEMRLKGGPIATYEQVTSLLKDGRRHKGVDFKAPVGTPVTMPWDGVVKRKNWNYRYNGGSLEVTDSKGRSVVFLHLESVDKSIKAGMRVRQGQQVATSGNTGRSTAPHLHYQVTAASGKVLDPYDLHETYRVGVPAEHQAAFDAKLAELRAHLEAPATAVAGADVGAPAAQ